MDSQSVVECVARGAQDHPSALALADRGRALTYGELWSDVRACADALGKRGVLRGDHVVVECTQDAAHIVCLLAVQLLGAVSVPIERNAPQVRVLEVMDRADGVLLVSPRAFDEAASVDVGRLAEEGSLSWGPGRFPESGDVAEILFSTGTTGRSKGIVMTHGANMAVARNVICGVEMKPGSVELIPMPLNHSHGERRAYANLVNGGAVVVGEGGLALGRMFGLIERYSVDAIDLSPSLLSMLFKLTRDRLGRYADQLDYVQLGSAPLPASDQMRLKSLLPKTRLYNFYGSTESGCSCICEFGQADVKPNCVGKPAVNARFIVVDDERNPVQATADEPGLLACAGSMNMLGYYGDSELTAQAMGDGYVYTSDIGYIASDGSLFVFGRKGDVINYGGVKVAPDEVESAIMASPIVRDCACVPVPDEISGQAPLLCVVLEPGEQYDEASFRSFVASVLDATMCPKRIEVVDEVPRTFNGKVRRGELVDRFS